MILWPAVVDRLLAVLPTLPGWGEVRVFDADPLTREYPKRFAVVGPEESPGSFTLDRSPIGTLTEETGDVAVAVGVQTGQAERLPQTRAAVAALVESLAAYVRDNQRLGTVLPAGSTVYLSADVTPMQENTGTAVRMLVTVRYTARTA